MNPYGVSVREANILGPVTSLKILYEGMPKTSGCENCAATYGDEEKDWCCKHQSPSMFYCEFLLVFEQFQKWSKEKKIDLVMRAIRNYLDNRLSKGCIFYHDGCQCYSERPWICRMYGVIPKESWDKRWDSLKDRQKDNFDSRPQCMMVQSEKEVTKEHESKWYKHIVNCEMRLGMPMDILSLHDAPGGPYRTFHDHLLIELFESSFLEMLSKHRLTNPSQDDIDATIGTLSKVLSESGIIK